MNQKDPHFLAELNLSQFNLNSIPNLHKVRKVSQMTLIKNEKLSKKKLHLV